MPDVLILVPFSTLAPRAVTSIIVRPILVAFTAKYPMAHFSEQADDNFQQVLSGRYPSTLRAVLQSGTFIEGWGVYAEQMMVNAGRPKSYS